MNLISNESRGFKLRCDERFTHTFTACGCVFKEITLVGSNQGNFFENATACSKCMLKTTVTLLALLAIQIICDTLERGREVNKVSRESFCLLKL